MAIPHECCALFKFKNSDIHTVYTYIYNESPRQHNNFDAGFLVHSLLIITRSDLWKELGTIYNPLLRNLNVKLEITKDRMLYF